MDNNWLEDIKNLLSDLDYEADKTLHDPVTLYNLMHKASRNIKLLMFHISYLESKLEDKDDTN